MRMSFSSVCPSISSDTILVLSESLCQRPPWSTAEKKITEKLKNLIPLHVYYLKAITHFNLSLI